MLERRLKLLSNWRTIATITANVIKELYSGADIYVFGGAAENRLTLLSDIDIAVVLEELPKDRAEMLAKIWEILEAKGIPQYYPLDIYILSKKEFEYLRGTKIKLA